MSKSIVLRSAAAALVAGFLMPAAVLAQSADRTAPGTNPYDHPGAHVCSQLERAAGVPADECGTLTLSEVAMRKIDRDNTN